LLSHNSSALGKGIGVQQWHRLSRLRQHLQHSFRCFRTSGFSCPSAWQCFRRSEHWKPQKRIHFQTVEQQTVSSPTLFMKRFFSAKQSPVLMRCASFATSCATKEGCCERIHRVGASSLDGVSTALEHHAWLEWSAKCEKWMIFHFFEN